jgi:hypothetical protein
MIFRIDIQQDANVWQLQITSPSSPAWPERKRSGALDSEGYPLPPKQESGSWVDPWLPLCQDDATTQRVEAYDRFIQGEPRQGSRDVEAFGGYLFSVLLGEDWAAIRDTKPDEPIRLQLSLPASPVWHLLPWEMMTNGDGPLTTFGKTVAITRLVRQDQVPEEPISMEIPLRVLFVVGRELDSQLRPGAEYLGLLRQLQCTVGDQQQAKGVALHTRLLMEATTEDLQKAVNDFKPAVVHLISHGQMSGNESVVVLTRYDTTVRRNPKPDPVNVDRFATLLGAADKKTRPQAVVLNACDTARIGDVQASFAAELVRRGIPLVVGMAGEVADAACQLFARQFYTALVEQRPADIAAAEGRRAALLHFKNYTQNFDWARAVFCQAEGLETQFKIQWSQKILIKVAEDLRPKRKREPFCGRLQWLPLFLDLFGKQIPNLAIESAEELDDAESPDRPQIGKSRLLEELEWLSVLDGWIPVRIGQVRERYSSFLHFAVNIFAILEATRQKFELKRANHSESVRAACAAYGIPYPANDPDGFMLARDKVALLVQPQQQDRVSDDTLQQTLRADFKALRESIETVTGPRKGVLLLCDQLDQEEAIEEKLVGLLNAHGLGENGWPVPVVFTYSKRSTGGKKLVQALKSNSHIEIRSLQPYDTFENAMACRQFLAWKKYVPSRMQRPLFEQMIVAYEKAVNGYPSKLFSFDQGIDMLKLGSIIIQFDDVEIMRQYS